MNCRILAACAASVMLALPASAGGLLSFLIPHHQVQVITNGDVKVDPSTIPQASKSSPVYYLAVSTGFRDYGPAMAGEKIPPNDQVSRLVVKTLATQGYKLATNKNPPQIIIVYGWGTLNTDRWFVGSNGYNPVLNRYQILRFLGADKVGLPVRADQTFESELTTGLSLLNPGNREIWDLGEDSYYILSITAYDINAAAKNKVVPLWSTKISCPSIGFYLGDVLPTMLSIAAPNIGKQTSRPIIVNADERYKPTIEIGDAKVIEEDVKSPSER